MKPKLPKIMSLPPRIPGTLSEVEKVFFVFIAVVVLALVVLNAYHAIVWKGWWCVFNVFAAVYAAYAFAKTVGTAKRLW